MGKSIGLPPVVLSAMTCAVEPATANITALETESYARAVGFVARNEEAGMPLETWFCEPREEVAPWMRIETTDGVDATSTARIQFVTLSAKMSALSTGWYSRATGDRMAWTGSVVQVVSPLPPPRSVKIVNAPPLPPEGLSTRIRLFP
jgi:hypothetical protein